MDQTIKNLSKVQMELKAPKGQKNSFGNYNYRSCEDILEAVKPLLKDSIITISDKIVLVGDRYYVKATAKFQDATGVIKNVAYAREPLEKKGMDSSQITGATSSYARKYALNGLLAIDDTKDADTMDNQVEPSKSAPKTPTNRYTFTKPQTTTNVEKTVFDEHVCPIHKIKMTKFIDENGLYYFAHVGSKGTKCYGK